MTKNREVAKRKIKKLFYSKVMGKYPTVRSSNKLHDGKHGHWLENQMGVKHNANNAPDLFGFEMKNHTTNKTSFGDWSPNWTVYKNKNTNNESSLTKHDFFKIFGQYNKEKKRFSWSGSVCPSKLGVRTNNGQILTITKKSIEIKYSYAKDNRPNKSKIVPLNYRIGTVTLAIWHKKSLKKKLESKFNVLGWFKCNKDKSGKYISITFGKPITFIKWVNLLKNHDVYFDCGMNDGTHKPRCQWRGHNTIWKKLIETEYR